MVRPPGRARGPDKGADKHSHRISKALSKLIIIWLLIKETSANSNTINRHVKVHEVEGFLCPSYSQFCFLNYTVLPRFNETPV